MVTPAGRAFSALEQDFGPVVAGLVSAAAVACLFGFDPQAFGLAGSYYFVRWFAGSLWKLREELSKLERFAKDPRFTFKGTTEWGFF